MMSDINNQPRPLNFEVCKVELPEWFCGGYTTVRQFDDVYEALAFAEEQNKTDDSFFIVEVRYG